MEDIDAVKIVRFIDHIIDHQTRQLKPSQLETPIGPDFPHELFAGYILKALKSDGRRYSRFREPTGKVISALRSMRQPDGNFVQASTTIAQHLFSIMNDSAYSARINPGDLMVALFRDAADESPQPQEYLALLKLDPSDDVVREIKIDDDKQQVIFVRKSTRIPEAGEKSIQKIALVGERREGQPYDVVLLDKEIHRKGVAQFFYDAFLESDLVRSASDGPRLILKPLKDYVTDQADGAAPPLQPGEKLAILRKAQGIVGSRSEVPLSEFVEEIVDLPSRSPEEVRTIRAGLVAAYKAPARAEEQIQAADRVAIDAREAARLTSKITYVLDRGIKIEGDREAMDNLVKVSEKVDKQGLTKITIRTKIFRLA